MNTANESNSADRQLKANNRSTSIQPEFVHLSLSEEGSHISLVVDDDLSSDVFSAELPSKLSAALLHRQCGTDFKATSPKENHMEKAYTNNSHLNINLTTGLKPMLKLTQWKIMATLSDDPAIWVNSTNARPGRIIGTDKKGALNSYDLAGKLVQSLSVGRVNNVDVGYKVSVAETRLGKAIRHLSISQWHQTGRITVCLYLK